MGNLYFHLAEDTQTHDFGVNIKLDLKNVNERASITFNRSIFGANIELESKNVNERTSK